MANFEQAIEALKARIPIPPDVIIELSELPNDVKDRTIKYLQQMSQVPQQQQLTGVAQ
jgi:hypothetical protein